MTTEPIPEAAVEAAAVAIYDGSWMNANESKALARAALEAAAPALRRQGAVRALREAADDMGRRSSERALIVAADKWGGYYGGVRAAAQNEAANLRARADEMEAGK